VRTFICLLVAAIATPAFADHEPVRDDIVDLRHQRIPNGRVFLGWTADGRAVEHIARCGSAEASGIPECGVWLEVTRQGHDSTRMPLLDPPTRCDLGPPCSDGTFPWTVPTEVASRAIRSERAALAELGPLQPSPAGPAPALTVVKDSCWVHLAAGTPSHLHTLAVVVAIDKRGCVADGGDSSVIAARLTGVQVSPDGGAVAATVFVESHDADLHSFNEITVVVAMPK
jgi:hypothetical protein